MKYGETWQDSRDDEIVMMISEDVGVVVVPGCPHLEPTMQGPPAGSIRPRPEAEPGQLPGSEDADRWKRLG
jgi:hypothetical protein